MTPPDQGFFMIVDGAVSGDAIAVAEWSSSRIHVYSHTGTLLHSLGGPGEGPGEFGRVGWVDLQGDEVIGGDQSLPRITRYSSDGGVEAILTVGQTPDGRQASPRGLFDNGMLLATTRPDAPMSVGAMSGPTAPVFGLLLLAADGSFVRPLGSLRGAEYVIKTASSGGGMYPSVFGQGSGLVVRGMSYYTYDPFSQRVHRYDLEGRITGTYGAGTEGEAATKELVAAVRTRLLADTPAEERPEMMFDTSPVPSRFPIYGWAGFQPFPVFAVSESGDVWMLKYGGVRTLTPEWEVYSPSGELRGVVAGPERSRILDIGRERVLFHVTAEDGVESILSVALGEPTLLR
jgi:hypothetical protein